METKNFFKYTFKMVLCLDIIGARERLHDFVDLKIEAMTRGEDGEHETSGVRDAVTDEELQRRKRKGSVK